jgi:hypothetical protein
MSFPAFKNVSKIHHARGIINERKSGLAVFETNTRSKSKKSWFNVKRTDNQTCHTSAAIEFLLPLQEWNHRAAPQGAQFAWLSHKTSPGQTVRGEGSMSMWGGKEPAVGPHQSVGA